MQASIPVAVILKRSSQTPEMRARLQQITARLGLEPTGTGASTLSYRVAPAKFAELFGRQAKAMEARPAGEADYGTPGGYEGEDLPIPTELVPYVDSITVVPPATRLHKPAG
jgi:hypothetical protein